MKKRYTIGIGLILFLAVIFLITSLYYDSIVSRRVGGDGDGDGLGLKRLVVPLRIWDMDLDFSNPQDSNMYIDTKWESVLESYFSRYYFEYNLYNHGPDSTADFYNFVDMKIWLGYMPNNYIYTNFEGTGMEFTSYNVMGVWIPPDFGDFLEGELIRNGYIKVCIYPAQGGVWRDSNLNNNCIETEFTVPDENINYLN